MHDSVNLPDKTRITFAKRFAFNWYFSSKNSESGVFCCRLQKPRIRQSVVKTCHKIFHYFTQKDVNFSR